MSSFKVNSNENELNEGDIVDKDYLIGNVHSTGTSSVIRLAKHLPSSTSLAVKIVKKNSNDYNHINSEIKIWSKLNHDNVLPLLHQTVIHQYFLIFSPICFKGSLLTHLSKYFYNGMSLTRSSNVFKQIVNGLQYLHNECNIVHRDLKLENVLLNSSGNWVLTDFGLSLDFSDSQSYENFHLSSGSLPYASPELIKPNKYKNLSSNNYFDDLIKCDIWSLGCILYALLCGKLPFFDNLIPRLQMKILSGKFINPPLLKSNSKSRERSRTRSTSRSRYKEMNNSDYSNEVLNLLHQCLNLDPNQRPFTNQILTNNWVNDNKNTQQHYFSHNYQFTSRSTSRTRSNERSRSRSRIRNQSTQPLSTLTESLFSSTEDSDDDQTITRGRPTIKRNLSINTNF